MINFREFLNEDYKSLNEDDFEKYFDISVLREKDNVAFQEVFTKSAKEVHHTLVKLLSSKSYVLVKNIMNAIEYLNKCKRNDVHDSFSVYETMIFPDAKPLTITFGGDLLKVRWYSK